ncbi:MAG TPA: DinB family protein [Bacteroidota bacterium]|nr:DinB family protein [Bacteroidota bacterium]
MAMFEREQFIQNWEREFQTTLKVLKSYPAQKADLQPHGKCPTAKDLAWRMVSEEKVFVNGALTGNFDFMNMPKPPATLNEIVATYERNHQENVGKIRKMSDNDFNKMVKFMVAPKTPGDVRSGDTLWMMMMDTIHHRGQFSIYLRMAEGRVPSIYGPSGDEPWM